MGIRESLLNTITSVGNSDFVRIVTSAGASSKATVQNLFKSFETGLGAKSSLGASDYIRVVGTDDVSYKNPISSLGSGLLPYIPYVSNVDANDYQTTGIWYISSGTNIPTTYIFLVVYRGNGAGDILQYAYTFTGDVYYRRRTSATQEWTAWKVQPKRAEIDTLNNRFKYIASGSFNDLQTYGIYLCQSLSNAPSTSFSQYCLIAFGSTATTKQIAFPTANDNNVYIRHYTNSTWSAWVAHVLP